MVVIVVVVIPSNNLSEGLGCQGDVQRLPGRCARVAGEICKGCRGDVQRLPGRCASTGKQSQLLLQPTEVELVLQVGVEFDNNVLVKRIQNLSRFVFT